MKPDDSRSQNVELQVDPEKLAMPEFKALWKRISPKSVYVVDFDTDELVKKSIDALNTKLHVPKVFSRSKRARWMRSNLGMSSKKGMLSQRKIFHL